MPLEKKGDLFHAQPAGGIVIAVTYWAMAEHGCFVIVPL